MNPAKLVYAELNYLNNKRIFPYFMKHSNSYKPHTHDFNSYNTLNIA